MCSAKFKVIEKEQCILLGGEELPLTLTEYLIFREMFSRPRQPHKSIDIALETGRWTVEPVQLKWHIGNIRQKLGKHAGVLRTRRYFGYSYNPATCACGGRQ